MFKGSKTGCERRSYPQKQDSYTVSILKNRLKDKRKAVIVLQNSKKWRFQKMNRDDQRNETGTTMTTEYINETKQSAKGRFENDENDRKQGNF